MRDPRREEAFIELEQAVDVGGEREALDHALAGQAAEL
jgi:hypothetical protein